MLGNGFAVRRSILPGVDTERSDVPNPAQRPADTFDDFHHPARRLRGQSDAGKLTLEVHRLPVEAENPETGRSQ
jgi:hypothetical protein